MYIPEDVRPFPSEKNPYCSKEMWRPQEDLKEEDEMRDPEWFPNGTHYNIYSKENHSRPENFKELREHGKFN